MSCKKVDWQMTVEILRRLAGNAPGLSEVGILKNVRPELKLNF